MWLHFTKTHTKSGFLENEYHFYYFWIKNWFVISRPWFIKDSFLWVFSWDIKDCSVDSLNILHNKRHVLNTWDGYCFLTRWCTTEKLHTYFTSMTHFSVHNCNFLRSTCCPYAHFCSIIGMYLCDVSLSCHLYVFIRKFFFFRNFDDLHFWTKMCFFMKTLKIVKNFKNTELQIWVHLSFNIIFETVIWVQYIRHNNFQIKKTN